MTRIRVLHTIGALGVGGAERLVVTAVGRLPAEEFESAVCCLAERGPLADEAEQLGARVWCVGRFPGLRHPVALWRLYRTIASFRPHVVHTHLQSANLYGRLAAWMAGVPAIVATEHNVYASKAARYIIVERMLARRTDALVAVSEEVRTFLSRQLRLDPQAIRIIRNGVAERASSPARAADLRVRVARDPHDVVLGTVASLVAKKGHAFLLRAVDLLRRRGVNCSLLLAGDGPARASLESLVEDLGLSSRVHFLGECRAVADVLAATDIFVLPSLVEGLPLALLEAMRAGKPVVATRVGGVPEVVVPGLNGELVEPGSDEALAAAIERLVQSPALRDEYGARARDTIVRGFTDDRYVLALSSLYRELVERAGCRAVSGG